MTDKSSLMNLSKKVLELEDSISINNIDQHLKPEHNEYIQRKGFDTSSFRSLKKDIAEELEYIEQKNKWIDEHPLWKEFYDIEENIPNEEGINLLKQFLQFSIDLLDEMNQGNIPPEKFFALESLFDRIYVEKRASLDKLYPNIYEKVMQVIDHKPGMNIQDTLSEKKQEIKSLYRQTE